jgi:hypothetical protein
VRIVDAGAEVLDGAPHLVDRHDAAFLVADQAGNGIDLLLPRLEGMGGLVDRPEIEPAEIVGTANVIGHFHASFSVKILSRNQAWGKNRGAA